MNSDVIISNPDNFEKKLSVLRRDGLSSLHIVSDFDRTATKCFVDGVNVPSAYGLIRKHDSLLKPISREVYLRDFSDIEAYAIQTGEEPLVGDEIPYSDVASRMYSYYYTEFEGNHTAAFKLRFDKMSEWWNKHFQLMADCGLTKANLDMLVREYSRLFRDDLLATLSFCEKGDIPFLFFSAGVGYFIEGFLRNKNALTPNVHILSNNYAFDDAGNVLGAQGQMIHVFSKGHVDLSSFAYTSIVAEHKNVLVLGDSLADVDMIQNIPHQTALKIGFLNEKVEENLERYKEVYDVLILNDGSFTYVKELLESIETPE